jgi:hypothetical protein
MLGRINIYIQTAKTTTETRKERFEKKKKKKILSLPTEPSSRETFRLMS